MSEDLGPLTRPQDVKPRVRLQPDGSMLQMRGGKLFTNDSFENFLTRTGINQGNVSSGGTYGFNPITRLHTRLEWAYRGSWIVGTIVDCIAEDMTRDGVEFKSDATPEDVADFEQTQIEDLQVWTCMCEVAKWARLYGGALAFIMIDGQKPDSPLDPDTVGKDQFKGIFPLDRWAVQPSLQELVTDAGPDLGNPKYYEVISDIGNGLPAMKIHYTRVVRMEGVRLPYWQRITENGWGMSVVERLFDRLVAFDSATQGAAQLVYKAHLRTYKVKDLRKIIAAGGAALDGLLKQMDFIRKYQSSEGMTLMDVEDEFEVHPYSFEGLDDILLQFGQQLSGACQIPLVRLFGQSPAGLNSTGESDLRTYYDGVKRQQVSLLARGVRRIYHCAWRSEHGSDPPNGWKVPFKSLYQMDEGERAEVASKTTDSIMKPYEAGLVPESVTLKDLKESSRVTGIHTSITDEMIAKAEKEDKGEVPEPELEPDSGGPGDVMNGEGGPNVGPDSDPKDGVHPTDTSISLDAAGWEEGKHPRDNGGEFASGGGGGGAGEESKPKSNKSNPKLPRFRPDGGTIVDTPPKGSSAEKKGLKVGHDVSGNYHDVDRKFMKVTGKVIGFVHNKRGSRHGDVAIYDEKGGTLYFVDSKNVYRQR